MPIPDRLVIILNPVSGPTRTRGVTWDWLEESARSVGWEAEVRPSSGPGDIERLAKDAVAEGARRIVVVGGDGSINEAVQHLVGTEVELGLIPAGTSNILANELGLPEDFRQAAEIAFGGEVLPIDVGIANGRYFTLMLGVGYDAVITEIMWPQLKRLAGQVAYTVAGIQTFVTHKAVRTRIQVDGKRLRRLVYMLVVANTRLYGKANTSVAEHADVRDGHFDLVVIRARAWYHVIFALIRVLARFPNPIAKIETMHARQVVLRSSRPVTYQLDGDPAGMLPVKIEIRPRALRVVVPRA